MPGCGACLVDPPGRLILEGKGGAEFVIHSSAPAADLQKRTVSQYGVRRAVGAWVAARPAFRHGARQVNERRSVTAGGAALGLDSRQAWAKAVGRRIQTEGRGGVWLSEQSDGFCGGGAGDGGMRRRRIRHRAWLVSGAVALVRDRCGLPTKEEWQRAGSSAAGVRSSRLTYRHAALDPCRASGSGRCGVSPLEGVGPHAVGPRGRPSPPNLNCSDT